MKILYQIRKKRKMKQIQQGLDMMLRVLHIANLVKELGVGKWVIVGCGSTRYPVLRRLLVCYLRRYVIQTPFEFGRTHYSDTSPGKVIDSPEGER